MTGLKRVAGAYMVILAVAVAVYFITNNFLVDSIDVPGIWYVFDALMAAGLALALIFNYAHKREESGKRPGRVRYPPVYGCHGALLPDRSGYHPVFAQLAFAVGPWR